MEQPQASAEGSPPPPPAAAATATAAAVGVDEQQPAPAKRKGKVKWFNSSKGYGFITPEEGSSTEDVFVHQTAIHAQGFRSLQQGEDVEYVAEEGEDGRWRAMEVKGPKGTYVQGAARYGSRGSRGRGRGRGAAAPLVVVSPVAAVVPRFPRFGGVCYSCGLVGHMARDCPSAFYPPPARGRGRAYPPRSCYLCGAIGHLQRNCPNVAPS